MAPRINKPLNLRYTRVTRLSVKSNNIMESQKQSNDKMKRASSKEIVKSIEDISGDSDDSVEFESIEKKIFEGTRKNHQVQRERESNYEKGLWLHVSQTLEKSSPKEENQSKPCESSKNSSDKRSLSPRSVNLKNESKTSQTSKSNSSTPKIYSQMKVIKVIDDSKIKSKIINSISLKSIKQSHSSSTKTNCNKSSTKSSKENSTICNTKSRPSKTIKSTTVKVLKEDTKITKSKSDYQIPSTSKDVTKAHNDRVTKSPIKSSRRSSKSSNRSASKKNKSMLSSDSEMSDWEEVSHKTSIKRNISHELDLLIKNEEVSDHEEGESSRIQIELDAPSLWGMKKRKKRKTEQEMFDDYLRKRANQRLRGTYVHCHKVHLLLLLGHGQYINKILNSEELLGSALSIITSKQVYPPKRTNIDYLEKLVKWYLKKINFVNKESIKGEDWKIILLKRFEQKEAKSKKEFVLMFIVICRALGMSIRLVQSLSPLTWKPSTEQLLKPKKSNENDDIKKVTKIKSDVSNEIKPKKGNKNKIISSDSENEFKKLSAKSKKKQNLKKVIKKEESSENYSSDDSDFEKRKNIDKRKKVFLNKMLKDVKGKQNEKKSLDANVIKERKDCVAEWAEIYVEEEENWICVDLIKGKVFCAADIAARVPPPVGYVTAYNADQSIKDVTKRYVTKWLAYESKLRCDTYWWSEVLSPYTPNLNAREKMENEALEESLLKQPLPKTISEYKNHPLYALQRHLLKFEALYPPNPDPMGFIRGEAVYPRECVKTLHSRDVWLKQAKTVMIDEEAYKVVTAMPKWDRVACKLIKDRPLDIFGEWQVENYKPPVAKDGKVPRNAYGNVELFKPEMLPIGCVHLNSNFEDLNRISRKLEIDCAPAMVGFDFHKGGTHPVFDGYVLCQEFEDILKDAWREEMVLKRKREEFRRQKRVLDNWKKLTKGLLVKCHVKETYGNYEDNSNDNQPTTSNANKNKDSKQSNSNKGRRKVIQRKEIEESVCDESSLVKEKVVLGIDLNSDTVAMAKKCYKNAQFSRGSIPAHLGDGIDNYSNTGGKNEVNGSSDEEENKLTEEQKKENLRKILNWGKNIPNEGEEGALGLSDDSDCEEKEQLTSPTELKSECSTLKRSFTDSINKSYKKHRSSKKLSKDESYCSNSNDSSDFETEISNISRPVYDNQRRRPKRKVAENTKVIVESNDDDISLGESDFDDESYKPENEGIMSNTKKIRKSFLSDDSS